MTALTAGGELLAFADAVVAGLQSSVLQSVFKTIDHHRGEFTRDEIKAHSFKSPALFVTVTGTGDTTQSAPSYAPVQMAATVVVRNNRPKREDRYKRGLALVGIAQAFIQKRLCAALADAGFDYAQSPNGVAIQNVFTREVDKMGVSMWLITWTQRVELSGAWSDQSLDDFVTLYGEGDIDPDDGVGPDGEIDFADEITLPQ